MNKNVSPAAHRRRAGEGTLIVPAGATARCLRRREHRHRHAREHVWPDDHRRSGHRPGDRWPTSGTWTALPHRLCLPVVALRRKTAPRASASDGATAESIHRRSADIGSTLELTVMATNASGTSDRRRLGRVVGRAPADPANMTAAHDRRYRGSGPDARGVARHLDPDPPATANPVGWTAPGLVCESSPGANVKQLSRWLRADIGADR